MVETLKGAAAMAALFDTLPKAADEQLRTTLPKMGAAVLAAQKQDVPIRTGDLWRGLSVQVLAGGHTIRIGLLNRSNTSSASGKTSYGGLYYGRFVEFGRRGQVVSVQRRRRVGGKPRTLHGRKRAEDLFKTYPMRVAPAPARPFVRTPAAESAALDAGENLADFWNRVLQRAGGSN
ncbi:HK97 gp10 family phage protein [Sphingomonas abietis]|uniref:HK97 gp10 family phage protein n=1 Tax=Sphingomonas abietis TaxID=3012344 RepID=A0ABY7NQW7_9SPHN|nr:HK97 gp10 family phage protein [Sphingomonas abietis]WBO23934.1 HK97 gp10 family phage protein [Sphingomonas abietis]